MLRYLSFATVLFLVTACADPTAEAPAEKSAGLTVTAAPDTSVAGVARLDLGTLGGTSSSATDIDATGLIIGTSKTVAERRHGFRWTEVEGMTDLPPLSGDDESIAERILPDGRIFGVSILAGRVTAVTWSRDGVPTPLEVPPPPSGSNGLGVRDINEQGAMAGTALINFKQSSWYWSPTAGFVDITATTPGKSNEGSVWGMSQTGYVIGLDRPRGLCDFTPGEFGGLCLRTFLWREDTGYIFIGSPDHSSRTDVRPGAVNNAGEVTGTVDNFGPGSYAFRWSRVGGWVVLSTPEGEGSGAGINERGTVVGEVHRPGRPGRAAIWLPSGARVDLALPDTLASEATGVNDRNIVAGSSSFGGAVHATRWTLTRP